MCGLLTFRICPPKTIAVETETGLQFGDEIMKDAKTVHDLLEAAVAPPGRVGRVARKAISDPESLLSDDDKRWIQPRTRVQWAIGYFLYFLHEAIMRTLFPVKLLGRENLPEKAPYVLVPNHNSFMDPSALISGLRLPLIATYYWAGLTNALFFNAFWRRVSRICQIFPIDPRRSPKTSLALGAAVLKRGDAMVWFPEGRRSPTGKLLPFRPGLALILREYPNIPVVPVFIAGTYESLPVRRMLPRPHKITVRIGKPMMVADLEGLGECKTANQRIMNALHNAVAALQN